MGIGTRSDRYQGGLDLSDRASHRVGDRAVRPTQPWKLFPQDSLHAYVLYCISGLEIGDLPGPPAPPCQAVVGSLR